MTKQVNDVMPDISTGGSGGSCSSAKYPNVTLYDKMMHGGMAYGTFCVPKQLTSYIILIIFPPLYVFIDEMNNGFKRIDRIIICFILTSFFYFPGLLYGLSRLNCGVAASQGQTNSRCGASN